MKRLVLLIAGLVSFLSAIKPHPGDKVDFYANEFKLILYRNPYKGVIQYVGSNFAIATPKDSIVINDIARRNWATFAYPDSFAYFVATGIYKDTTDYIFYATPSYIGNTMTFYWKNLTVGYSTLGKAEIHKLLTNPHPPSTAGNWAVIYIASDIGVYSHRQNIPPSTNFSKIALIDKPVYSIVFDPDSTGPISQTSPPTLVEVLYAAAENGVYKIRVTKNAVQYPETLAQQIKIGNLNEKVKAVAIHPVTREIYAGGAKLWKYDGTSWQTIPNILNVNEIKIFGPNTIVVLTEDGLFYSTDSGASWNSALSGYNLYDADYGFGYYWVTSLGNGVFRAPSLGEIWEKINAGFEHLQNFGSLNCRAIYFDNLDNTLLLANDQGVWKFEPSQNIWMNVSRNMHNFMPTSEVEVVKYVMENYVGQNLFEKMKNVMKVKDEELWDMNADSVIILAMFPLVVSDDSSVAKVKPIYGYFDPYDLDPSNPDASLKEIFLLNFKPASGILYKDPEKGIVDTLILAKYLAYLFGEYACWSLEHDELKPVRVGFSMLSLYLAGFEIFKGNNIGIKPGRDFSSSIRRIGKPLFDYTTNWRLSPVARDFDRERLSYWFLYLRERLINAFNNDTAKADSIIFKVMLRDKNRDGKDLFDYYLKKYTGRSFAKTFESWAIANLLDNPEIEGGIYGYNAVDSIFNYSNPLSYSEEIKDSTSSSTVISPQSAQYFRKFDVIPHVYKFDFQDDFGDTLYGFKVYRILFDSVPSVTPLSFDTTKIIKDTILILKKARNIIRDPVSGNVMYVVVNTSSLPGYFAYSYEEGAPPYKKKYLIQNPVATNFVDFYVVGRCDAFGRVISLLGDSKSDVNPVVIFRPVNKKLPTFTGELKFQEKGDSLTIYKGSVSLSSNVSGDVFVYCYAQDFVGNTTVIFDDTISVKEIKGGGLYAFLNGEITLDVPENSGFSGKVLASRLPKNYLENSEALAVYSIGNSSMIFLKPVKLIFHNKADREDISVYRINEKGIPVECETYRQENDLYVYTNSLGIFLIMEGKPVILPGELNISLSSNLLPFNSSLKFFLSLPSKSTLEAKIYDAMGREVKEARIEDILPGIHEFNLPLNSSLSRGVYFMKFKIFSENKTFSKKFKLIIF